MFLKVKAGGEGGWGRAGGKAVAGCWLQLGSPSCWSLALAAWLPEASPRPALKARSAASPGGLSCQGPVSPSSAGMSPAGGAGGSQGCRGRWAGTQGLRTIPGLPVAFRNSTPPGAQASAPAKSHWTHTGRQAGTQRHACRHRQTHGLGESTRRRPEAHTF